MEETASWEVVASRELAGDGELTSEQWVKAVTILVEKPQSVDRRLTGQLGLGQLRRPPLKSMARLARRLASLDPASWDQVEEAITQQHQLEDEENKTSSSNIADSSTTWLFILQRIVPKNASRHQEYVRLVVMGESSCTFLTVGSSEPRPYLLNIK